MAKDSEERKKSGHRNLTMILKPREPKNLSEWLETAAKGIAAAGQERIAREIEAHYAEAVEAHVTKGESEPIALAKALDALGDAMTARRRFRKEHLTVKDEQWTVGFWSRNYGKFALATNFLTGFMLILTVPFAIKLQKYAVLFFVPLFLGVIAAQIRVFRRLRQPGNQSKLSSMTLMNRLSFNNLLMMQVVRSTASVTISQIAYDPFMELNRLMLIVVSLGWILTVIESFQKWKKIQRIEQNQSIGT
jgi:hypothetical protein